MKNLLKMSDLSNEDIVEILDLAEQLKYELKNGIEHFHSMVSNMGGSSRIERLRTQVVSMIDAISVDPNNRYSVVAFSSGATVRLNKGSADQAKTVVRSLKA